MSWALFPQSLQHAVYTPDVNDERNITRGIAHRIGRKTPALETAVDSTVVRRIIHSILGPLPVVEPLGFEEWLSGTHYNMVRRQQLRAAYSDIANGVRLPDFGVDLFIKREFYPVIKNPRIICARRDDAKVILGPIFAPIEQRIFSLPMFIKHIPVSERARYIVDYIGPGDFIYFENDHTSFEVHAHTTFGVFEHEVYRQMLSPADYRHVKRLLGPQRVRTRGVKARVMSRMSGEMNTSLGNALANLLSFYYIVASSGHDVTRVRCIIEGDDAIFAVPRDIAPCITTEAFRRLGFVVELSQKPSLGRCGFCSTYFSDDGQFSVIEPIKVISQTLLTLHRPHGRVNDLRFSKALSCAISCRGTPVLQAFSQRLKRENPSGRFVFDDWWTHQKMQRPHPSDPVPISHGSRELFCSMFGWSVEMQIDLERHFDECPLEDLTSHPFLQEAMEAWRQNFYRTADPLWECGQ